MRGNYAGTGTYATDAYRERKALEASQVLAAGHGVNTVAADHNGGELCVEVIARLKNELGKRHNAPTGSFGSAQDAVKNLRLGFGYNKASADHAAGQTCAQVIAAATS